MPDRKNITGMITWIVALVMGTGVITIPFVYFLLSYRNIAGSLETAAEINARFIAQVISANPELWEFEQLRFMEYISPHPTAADEEKRRIVNAKNETVNESPGEPRPPLIIRSFEIMDSGAVVGRIEIVRSLRPLLKWTALIALFTLPAGLGVFLLLYVSPIRTIYRAELALKETHERLQAEIVERIRVEAELLALNNELEARVVVRTAELEALNRDLKAEIDDRSPAEEALRENEKRYRILVENSNDLIYSTDVNGYFTYVNHVAERFVGWPKSEIMGKHYLSFVRPDFHEKIVTFYREQYRENKPNTYFEYPIITRDGETKWIGQNVQPLLSGWNVIGFQAVARDITDRRQAQAALVLSEEKYRNLVETINEAIYETDESGIVTFVSASAIGLKGYEPSDVVGRHITEFVYHEDLPRLLEMYQQILSGPIPLTEYRLILKSGELLWVQVSSRAMFEGDRFKGLRGTLTDISERKRAEQAQRESETKYKDLVDFLPIALFEIDLQGNVTSGNPAIFEMFGYPQDDLNQGLHAFQMIASNDLDRVMAKIQRVLSGERSGGTEYTGIRKDGSTFPFMIYSSSIMHGSTPVGLRGAIIDLTEQKQIEASLHKSSQSLTEAQRIAHIGNWERDIHSEEMYWSDEIYRIAGTTPREFAGTNEAFLELVYPEDRDAVRAAVRKVIDDGTRVEIEHRMVRLDGSVREIHQQVEPLCDDKGETVRVIGIVQDVTERNQAERELQHVRDLLLQSEKLASIGRLAAGVAHEILNPVNIISMELQILQTMENMLPEVGEELKICMAQVRRIVTIAESLKQFSRIPKQKMIMDDINGVIADVMTLSSSQFKIEGITTEIQYHFDMPKIVMNREKIEQVILNLISNAISAMEGKEKKVLRVITSKEAPGNDGYLRIMVADTGTGIRKEDMPKIFDPFFTRKEQGKGTGLGLFISYGIIHDHGGRIWAENNEKGGASFFIELPVNQDAVRFLETRGNAYGTDTGRR